MSDYYIQCPDTLLNNDTLLRITRHFIEQKSDILFYTVLILYSVYTVLYSVLFTVCFSLLSPVVNITSQILIKFEAINLARSVEDNNLV